PSRRRKRFDWGVSGRDYTPHCGEFRAIAHIRTGQPPRIQHRHFGAVIALIDYAVRGNEQAEWGIPLRVRASRSACAHFPRLFSSHLEPPTVESARKQTLLLETNAVRIIHLRRLRNVWYNRYALAGRQHQPVSNPARSLTTRLLMFLSDISRPVGRR